MTDLSAYEQWMVRSNLARIQAGESSAAGTIALLRANGYNRVASAVEEGVKVWTTRPAQQKSENRH